jgi:hypothetical protein
MAPIHKSEAEVNVFLLLKDQAAEDKITTVKAGNYII